MNCRGTKILSDFIPLLFLQAEVSKTSSVVARIFSGEHSYTEQFWLFLVMEFSVLSEIFQMQTFFLLHYVFGRQKGK